VRVSYFWYFLTGWVGVGVQFFRQFYIIVLRNDLGIVCGGGACCSGLQGHWVLCSVFSIFVTGVGMGMWQMNRQGFHYYLLLLCALSTVSAFLFFLINILLLLKKPQLCWWQADEQQLVVLNIVA